MEEPALQKAGYPIGSGKVESACKGSFGDERVRYSVGRRCTRPLTFSDYFGTHPLSGCIFHFLLGMLYYTV
jgi:hypothetical protein